MCHSSHVMRHAGYRHLSPAKQKASETSSIGFYIHAFLLLCWFAASMHWAWVWYTQRRDARRKCEERDGLPRYGIQLRHGQWGEGGNLVGFSPWPREMNPGEVAGKVLFYACADWLTGDDLVVSSDKAHAHSVSLDGYEKMLPATPSMCRCEGEGCRRRGWHRAASRERYLYHQPCDMGGEMSCLWRL